MSRRKPVKKEMAALLLSLAGLVLLLAAIILPHSAGDTSAAARRVQRLTQKRLTLLESYIDKPQSKLPDDMVIYRYCSDTLQSWRGQFTVTSDDIASRVLVQRLVNPRINIESPLRLVGDTPTFLNMGPKWYLAWRIERAPDELYIVGLEIMNSMDTRSFNGVNRRLRLSDKFSIKPISYSGGSAVEAMGEPRFKVMCDTLTGTETADATLILFALALILAGVVLFQLAKKSLPRALMCIVFSTSALAAVYFWGRGAQNALPLFSPSLYAGDSFLYSLAAIVLVNLELLLCTLHLFIAREDIFRRVRSPRATVLSAVACIAAIAVIVLYTHQSLRSIILNSSISLELYKFGELSRYSLVVFVSYLTMLTSLGMLLQMLQPALSRGLGVHIDFSGTAPKMILSVIVAACFVAIAGDLGFEKEEDRAEVWANRLSVDRDITLEVQLQRVEKEIASDLVISALAELDNTENIISNRIIDNWLFAESQDYSISVRVLRDRAPVPELVEYFQRRIQRGTPIAEDSHFLCSDTPGGHSRYDALFVYYSAGSGLSRVLLEVVPKTGLGEKGYASLLGLSSPGRASLPSFYSYARYIDGQLRLVKGGYAFPTTMTPKMLQLVFDEQVCHFISDGYVHFTSVVSDGEAVLVSRPVVNVVNYIIAGVLIALAQMMILSFFLPRKRRTPVLERNYYRTRITWLMMTSLILTLVVMAAVSVVFVYRRNEDNRRALMTDKVESVQALVQNALRVHNPGPAGLHSQEVAQALETVSENTKTDISLYGADGRLIMSTAPEAFDRMLLGCRIDAAALDQIMGQQKRFWIQRERIGGKRCHCMYAPLIAPGGAIAGILCSPYTDESYDFERDAVMHLMTILTAFLLLLIIARFMAVAVVDRMFKPLSEMGRKMNVGGVDSLEYIEYSNKDEISTLVDAYNRMVTELSESTRKLAQAERDKAWSGMARQVAHEIKNPLTPMKLQLQRVIRLKKKGDPMWQERFDEMSTVLLDHIDILTETANEFSTFAKLYTEEPTDIDLDELLQSEISMFDSGDGVSFEYLGMQGAMVQGPKPQLTRVFVNLIGNAVQAVGEGGKVLVSLRKSSREGFLSIVVEDNGPGVAPENISKLFTPNFTTKTGGSGLGLAISRSILEKCGATISYSRSFALGGACFTVEYPL